MWDWAKDVISDPALANATAIFALIVSVRAFRKSGPRLTVKLGGSVIVDSKVPRWNLQPVEFVTVTNRGAAPAYVQSVYLESSRGSVPANYVDVVDYDVEEDRSKPIEIAANGGKEVWMVHRQQLRDLAARHASDTEVKFRARVESGGKKLKSRTSEIVHPNEPRQVPTRKQSVYSRSKKLLQSYFIPKPVPDYVGGRGLRVEDLDLAKGQYQILVKNEGGGVVRGATLELLASTQDGNPRKVRVGEPISIPALRSRQAHPVWVPLADDGEWAWWVRFNGKISGNGLGAVTREAAERGLRELGEQGTA